MMLRLRLIEVLPRALFFLFARNEANSLFWYLALLESQHVVALLNADLNSEAGSWNRIGPTTWWA